MFKATGRYGMVNFGRIHKDVIRILLEKGRQRVSVNVICVLSAMWEKVLSIQDCKRRKILFFFFLIPMSPEENRGDFEYIDCLLSTHNCCETSKGDCLSLTACGKGAVRL